MEIVNTLPEEKWRHFVEKHPDGNIFHTPEIFQVFSRTKDYSPELWAAIDEAENILALMLAVHIQYYKYLPRYLTSRSVVFGGVLCSSGKAGLEGLDLLLRTYKRNTRTRSVFTEVRNITPIGEMEPVLIKQDFLFEDHLNYLIYLNRQPEALFKSIGRRTRKHIRHSLNQDTVVIQEVRDAEHLTSCYSLLDQVYRRVKVPLADRSLFEAAFDVLYPIGRFRITLAKVGQAPVAVSMELLYKDIIYGWYGGVDRTYSSYVPNELLMWKILKWGSENGFCLYDFGGAGKPGDKYGVRDFKAKFGGQLVNYGRNIYIHSSVRMKLSSFGYTLLRNMP